MKLIIDVPEETFNCLKNMVKAECVDPYSLADIIVNKSKPLDNLKEELHNEIGEWITKGYEPFGKCNICGGICEINNFCGHCGVKMKYNTEK